MEYTLRNVTDEDFEFLFHLHSLTLGPYVEQIWGWDEDWQRANYAVHQPLDFMQIIQVNGQDVGVLSVEDQDDALMLRLIEIHPDRQGQGLGSQVITALQEQGQFLKKPVRLRVLTNNPALNLYKRLGFRIVESTPTHHMMLWIAV